MSDKPMEKPDETGGTPDEPVTEIEVTTAVERFLEAVEALEARQKELRADVNRLMDTARMTGKALHVLLEVARQHNWAIELLKVEEPPELPGKPN